MPSHIHFQRIHQTIRSLGISTNSSVLEVGAGTGLSLAAYPHDVRVTAVDLAPEMLAQAEQKIQQEGWEHIRLQQMDALDLNFADNHFDYVFAFHLVSVVPDHRRLMDEMCRVSKPGGSMVVINHFRSPRRWVASMVDLVDPVTKRLGWSTTLRLENLVDGVPVRVDRVFKSSPTSLFTIVEATKLKPLNPHPRLSAVSSVETMVV